MQRHYRLRPSRRLAFVIFLLALAALFPLWLFPWSMAVTLVCAGMVLSLAAYRLLRDAKLSLRHSCVAFRLEGHGEIVLVLRNGEHLQGVISPDSLVTPHLVILNLVPSNRRGRSLVILPDNMGSESFRRLRVALKWGVTASQGAL
ncbi:MAG TPA: protein YgfX [Sideroxyarcus sp.]|nr:protein YgfX [Sideroxyarcus sp.]